MNHIRPRAAAAVFVTAVTLGCSDIPILPQWDADFYAPLGGTNLSGVTPGLVIPAGQSANVPGPVRTLPMDGTAAQILDEALSIPTPVIRLQVRLTKTANLTVALADTLFFAADSASLATTAVRGGLSMAAGETSRVDTLALGSGFDNLIRQLTNAKGTLWMQARGRITSGASPITVAAGDSINVQVGLLIRVPVAGGN